MSNELNLSLVEGNLTRDPEIFATTNGHHVCKFDIAVNFKFKKGDVVVEDVSFVSVNAWNKVGQACFEYLKKGSRVRVRGRLKQDSWTAKDGSKRKKLYIEASAVDFLRVAKKSDEAEKEKEKEHVPF